MADASALDLRRPRTRRGDLPARLRERVLAALPGRVERIVLFGSQARGEAHDASDWDFAIFLDHDPTEDDRRLVERRSRARSGKAFDAEVQTLVFGASRWLARDELACNIRDHGLIIYGPTDVPRIERPVLEHARDALAKAERFAEQAAQAPPQAYETVVHNSYYAMFHAARAALLALEGGASTNHGQVVDTFAATVKRRKLGVLPRSCAARLIGGVRAAHRGRLRQRGPDRGRARLREAVAPFLAWAREQVERRVRLRRLSHPARRVLDWRATRLREQPPWRAA